LLAYIFLLSYSKVKLRGRGDKTVPCLEHSD